jgi:hypothetical protein
MDLRTDNPLRFQFITVFFFRRVLYASTFILLSRWQFFQISYAVFTVFFMVSYLLIIKPYKSVLSSVLSVFNEFMLFLTVAIPGRFLEPFITPIESRIFGNLLISIIIATIAVNWIAIILYGVITFIHKKLTHKELKTPKRPKVSFSSAEIYTYDKNESPSDSRGTSTTTLPRSTYKIML